MGKSLTFQPPQFGRIFADRELWNIGSAGSPLTILEYTPSPLLGYITDHREGTPSAKLRFSCFDHTQKPPPTAPIPVLQKSARQL
jgi:hypothetical protein